MGFYDFQVSPSPRAPSKGQYSGWDSTADVPETGYKALRPYVLGCFATRSGKDLWGGLSLAKQRRINSISLIQRPRIAQTPEVLYSSLQWGKEYQK